MPHIPYRVPRDVELPERLPGVLAVVYLIATEAHAPSAGDRVVRVDLESEALGLARLLFELMPTKPRSQHFWRCSCSPGAVDRRASTQTETWCCCRIRTAPCGIGRPLPRALLASPTRVRRSGGVAGPYQLASPLGRLPLHGAGVGGHRLGPDRHAYDLLLSVTANPVVALNRSVAVGERDGAAAELSHWNAIASLSRSYLWRAARADALRRLDRLDDAQQELRIAMTLARPSPIDDSSPDASLKWCHGPAPESGGIDPSRSGEDLRGAGLIVGRGEPAQGGSGLSSCPARPRLKGARVAHGVAPSRWRRWSRKERPLCPGRAFSFVL